MRRENNRRSDRDSGDRFGSFRGGDRDGGNRFGGGSGGFRSSGPRDFGPREMHKAICSDCGNECEVPFKPTEGKPVYCKACYAKHKPQRF